MKHPWESLFQELIYVRTYARWLSEEQRREEWEETIDRYFNFLKTKIDSSSFDDLAAVKPFVLMREILPSMRALWSAGEAARQENLAIYNCAYTPIDSIRRLPEILYILLNGTGVGFSVEQKYIDLLPIIPVLSVVDEQITFEDSKIGWAEGYLNYLTGLFQGKAYRYNLSKIRAAGTPLKIFGGRACGPEALSSILDQTQTIFTRAQGRKLTSTEWYDLTCILAQAIATGGVRRSSLLSLSDLYDQPMRDAKIGGFWVETPHRRFANNSAVYHCAPSEKEFWTEWESLEASGLGERGIFNREACKKITQSNGRRNSDFEFGTNPCSEIILRPQQFCNLSEVVCRSTDTLNDLRAKVRAATFIGLMQSTFTDFNFLGEEWQKNCEEERLLGVSLTGTCDHPILNGTDLDLLGQWLSELKKSALESASVYSRQLGINLPTAITCIKPSGTVSQLINSSSGLHPRYSRYYIRRVRLSRLDPLCQLLIDRAVPHQPEVGQNLADCTEIVFEFPIESPSNSVLREHRSAIETLEYYKVIQTRWCEHKPSATIYVREHEWVPVGKWLRENWDEVTGLSFLPYDNGRYALAPFEEITQDQYRQLALTLPKIDFSELKNYEKFDQTIGFSEPACTAGGCELLK